MAKSIKLKDNIYLDISSIVWGNDKLNTRLTGEITRNVDLNDYITTGVYYFTSGCTNAPTTYLYCLVLGTGGNNRVIQLGIGIGGTEAKLYFRKCNDGVWSNWKQL